MKKQILFLALFVMAVFTSVNKSYGQATHGNTNPIPITCTPNALNPIAGVPYSYQADISPAGGTAIWHAVYNQTNLFTTSAWAATDEVVGTGNFISAATGYGSNATAASPSKTTITWKSEGLASVDATKALLVALEYTAPATGGCANNLQVFQITPKNAFTLDITAMDNTGATSQAIGTPYAQCFSKIASAVYTVGAPGTVKMDYGDNTTYFEVIAANFTTSFNPTFKIAGLQAGQTADVSWGYTVATATTVIATGTTNATLTPFTAATEATDTSNGVSIYVKVVVHNLSWEGIANQSFTLAVEGTNVASQPDVLADCTVPAAASQFEDIATQTLNARPIVDNPTPTPFLIKN